MGNLKIESRINLDKFAIVDFWLVVTSFLTLSLFPQFGWQPLTIALFPWLIRILNRVSPFRRNYLNGFLLIFFVTALIGVWTAYDRESASHKFWLISCALLLYFSIANQPKQNFGIIFFGLALFGGFVTTLYLLVYDWSAYPGDIQLINRLGMQWMQVRPSISVDQIHANVVGGVNAISLPFCIQAVAYNWKHEKKILTLLTMVLAGILLVGLFLSSSRAAWLAVFVGGVPWVLLNPISRLLNTDLKRLLFLFIVVLISILLIVLFYGVSDQLISYDGPLVEIESFYSRIEIYRNLPHLMTDFPFTGGGLNSFAGLYSRYILDVPYLLFSYGHNLYLDIALEQGLLGLMSWGCIFLFAAYHLLKLKTHQENSDQDLRLMTLMTMVSMVVLLAHGVLDDPVYSNSWGYLLLFASVGLSQGLRLEPAKHPKTPGWVRAVVGLLGIIFLLFTWVVPSPIKGMWLANLGAVKMARVELAGWPVNRSDAVEANALSAEQKLFEQALTYDPKNRTAYHRLGLIALKEWDFDTAEVYLTQAYDLDKTHRGIVKTLGFTYVWQNRLDKAISLLQTIPEATYELEIYSSWWQSQGRLDLSQLALEAANELTRVYP